MPNQAIRCSFLCRLVTDLEQQRPPNTSIVCSLITRHKSHWRMTFFFSLSELLFMINQTVYAEYSRAHHIHQQRVSLLTATEKRRGKWVCVTVGTVKRQHMLTVDAIDFTLKRRRRRRKRIVNSFRSNFICAKWTFFQSARYEWSDADGMSDNRSQHLMKTF